MKNIRLSLFALLLIITSCHQSSETIQQPYLIILSLDGFRWDYPQMANTPTLDSLKKAGVILESLKPSFPTKTFPNHYTIATGLYPDHHGIVGNYFHAPDMNNRIYKISDREAVGDDAFYGGEPIWVTAETQGMTSATFFWVGSEAAIKGVRPTYWYTYDHTVPFEDRIDSVVNWLSLPEKVRPHLIMWYYSEPDHTGHMAGPESDEIKNLVEELDSYLANYFREMRKLPIYNQLNFIITSDHGMTATSDDRRIFIDQIIDTAEIEFMDGITPNMNIKVKEGMLPEVYADLKSAEHLSVWKHLQLPERLHYGKNSRTQDLCVVADPGWTIVTSSHPDAGNGDHGYDNDLKDMHAIFYAAGPAFKKDYVHPTIENVNLYILFARILGLNAAKTDGSFDNVKNMLKVNDND